MKYTLIILVTLMMSCQVVFAEMYDSEPVHGNPSHVHVDIPRYDKENKTVGYADFKYWFDNQGKYEQAIGAGAEIDNNGVWEARVGYSGEWGRK